jgi:site-specific DNA recombinase
VSELDGDETGTVKAQLEYLQEFCQHKRWTIVETYIDDGVSGTLAFRDRAEGSRLLRDAARRKWDAVVFKRVDRIGRSVKVIYDFIAELDSYGRGFVSATEPIETTTAWGKALLGVMAVFAELERNTIIERMHDGRRDTAKHGGHYGGPPPVGYFSIPGPEFPVLAIDHALIPGLEFSEADLIRRLFSEFHTEQLSLQRLEERLTAESIPCPTWLNYPRRKSQRTRAHGWSVSTLHRILTNPLYKGQLDQAGYRLDAPHLALIDPAEWDAVQQQLQANRKGSKRNSKHVYLLGGGLMTCAACGLSYTGVPKDGRRYYICGGRAAPKLHRIPRCPAPILRADEREQQVWRQVVHAVNHPGETMQRINARLATMTEKRPDLQNQADDLTSILKGLSQARTRYQRLFARGHLTEAQYDLEIAGLDEEQAEVEERLAALTALLADQSRLRGYLDNAESRLGRLREQVEQATTPEQQRAILRQAVERITVEQVGEAWQIRVSFVFGDEPQVASRDISNTENNLPCLQILLAA